MTEKLGLDPESEWRALSKGQVLALLPSLLASPLDGRIRVESDDPRVGGYISSKFSDKGFLICTKDPAEAMEFGSIFSPSPHYLEIQVRRLARLPKLCAHPTCRTPRMVGRKLLCGGSIKYLTYPPQHTRECNPNVRQSQPTTLD